MRKKSKKTLAHDLLLEELHEMEDVVPMTAPERDRLRKWVYSGHSVDENPWKYRTPDGYEMNYLDAYHRHMEITWGAFYRPLYKVVPAVRPIENRFPGRELGNEWDFS